MMDPYFSSVGEDVPTVVFSIVIAILAVYVGLDLAGRVHRAADRTGSNLWLVAGSIAMGTGVWCMHFVGMSAARYPFSASYDFAHTFLSWILAATMAMVLLWGTAQAQLTRRLLVGTALAAGLTSIGMHYVGVAAMMIAPAPTYLGTYAVAASVMAILGSGSGMALFLHLRDMDGLVRQRWQFGAALMFGGALAATHYLGMASIDFDDVTHGTGTRGLDVQALGPVVGLAAIVFLSLMLLLTALGRRGDLRARTLGGSLERANAELKLITFRDGATRLPNRLVFEDRLAHAAARADRSHETLAVLFIDVDRFRSFDHAWSAAHGNMVLQDIAARLQAVSRASDTLVCLGGDQFLIMLEGLTEGEPAARAASEVSRALRQCTPGNEQSLPFTASIGITLYPVDGAAGRVVANAGAAMAAAKATGGNSFRFFEAQMDADAHAHATLLEDLQHALARQELELFYQPKVHAGSGMVAGVEALLRWRHPGRGLVSPAVFIPIAEKYGLMNELGSWVITAACKQMHDWRAAGWRMRVAINLSVYQLRSADVGEEIADALARFGIEPALLTCELTESAAMDDDAAVKAVFQRLSASGVQISIDDFGTGYSSLSYLRRLPVRQLKVDRSFVTDIGVEESARSVVAAIISLAHSLKLEVVAEGVETEVQRQLLLELGCDKFQGFLFAKPMPPSVLIDWLIHMGRSSDECRISTAVSVSGSLDRLEQTSVRVADSLDALPTATAC